MDYLKISDQFKLPFPDGFRVLSQEERNKMNLLEGGECIILSDENRHMILSFGWKETGMLAAMLLSEYSLENNMESSIRQGMQPYGFQKESSLNRQIAGCNANGLRYLYTAKDTDMLGESYVLRSGRTVVYCHLYARAALRDESLPVWNELLDSIVRE